MKRRLMTLSYDIESGELLPVNWNSVFAEESVIFRMDVMQDAVTVIAEAYEDAIEAWKASEKWRGDHDVH